MIVIERVEPGLRLVWRDLQQRFTAEVLLEPAADGNTRAQLVLEAPWWRGALEQLRPLPRQALARLYALCQTAASL